MAENAEGGGMNWINVNDRMPDENTDCIVFIPSRGSVTVCKYFKEWSLVMMPDFSQPAITHWMPLPTPPNPT